MRPSVDELSVVTVSEIGGGAEQDGPSIAALCSANLRPSGRGLSAPPALVSTEVRGSLLHHSAVPQPRLVGGSELHHIQSAVLQVGGSQLHQSAVLRSRLHLHPSAQMVGGSRLHLHSSAQMVRGSLLHHSVVPQARLVRGSELHHVATSALCSTILQFLRLGWSGALNSTTSKFHHIQSAALRSGALSSTCTRQHRWSGALCSTILRSLRLGWLGALNSTMLRLRLSAPPFCSSSGSVGRGL